jgi:hypothetical protein
MARKRVSRSGRSGAEGFSYFDHATRADVGMAPRHGDQLLKESCDHLPLFDCARSRATTARAAQAARGAGATARLSIGHKTSNPKPTTANLFQVWKDASLAIFPGIPNLNPNVEPPAANRGGKRGKVVTLSDASRRNLMLYLAKLNREAKAFTMALTLPGDVQFLTSAKVHLVFKKLCNRLTASRLFPSVGFVWKRELQRRGALHYHLLLYGLEHDETRAAFQRWIAGNWNDLVCASLSDEEKGKHLRWHLHAKNMEAVRGNIARYFAKYLGKPLEIVREEIPGRWWGKVNAKALPLSEIAEMPLPARAAVIAHRIARKLLQKRTNEAKHRAISKAVGLVDSNGNALISPFFLLGMRNRFRNLDLRNLDLNSLPVRSQRAYDFLFLIPANKGLRWGKAKRSKFGRFSRVKLISNQSPATALQIMRYLGDTMNEWRSKNPF